MAAVQKPGSAPGSALGSAPGPAPGPEGRPGPRHRSNFEAVWVRFRRNRLAMLGLGILVLLYGMMIFAPQVTRSSWDAMDLMQKNFPPSWTHWLGTDQFGKDVFDNLVWGSRISLKVGLIAALISVLMGSAVGAIAGYYGGSWIDIALMRFVEALEAFPVTYLLLALAAIVRQSNTMIFVIIGMTSWPTLAWIVRGQFLSLREREFAEASRALGARDMRIIFRHILPNAAAPIIVSATLRVGAAILAEASLNFIGLGTPPPYPTWGTMLYNAQTYMRYAPWAILAPGLAIGLTVLAFNFVGDGLRDALDPKLKH